MCHALEDREEVAPERSAMAYKFLDLSAVPGAEGKSYV